MSLKVSELVKTMLTAAKGELEEQWPEVREYAKTEAKKIAHTLTMIETLKVSGKIGRKQAKILLDMQQQSSRVVILTIKGLGLLASEAAINAALKSVRDMVNGTIGWRLL